ncbi:MAG: hypothetical protein JWQ37_1437 [Blastococcus sp.]|nr:hypothetical protein [Blastococcus sp.]
MPQRILVLRTSTISSWERPTKFHHITRSSSNGSPPSRNTRAPPGASTVSSENGGGEVQQ